MWGFFVLFFFLKGRKLQVLGQSFRASGESSENPQTRCAMSKSELSCVTHEGKKTKLSAVFFI